MLKKINRKVLKVYELKAKIWKKHCQLFNIKIYEYIHKNLFIYFLANKNLIKKLNQLVYRYNLLVFEILNFRKSLLKISFNQCSRITQKNIPCLIVELQCWFLESPFLTLLTILDLIKNKYFKDCNYKKYRFKKIKYVSNKIMASRIKFCNLTLMNILLQKLPKNYIKKNCKKEIIRGVWMSNFCLFERQFLSTFPLQDFILQKIVWMSIFPIVEFQADIFSFAYRPGKSMLMCHNHLANHCFQNQEVYKKKFTKSKYLMIWNFKIQKCFKSVSHQIILELTPLCDKYLFFLKQWLVTRLIKQKKGKGCWRSNSITLKTGVFKNGMIGRNICNSILDGIDELLLKLKCESKIPLSFILKNRFNNFVRKIPFSINAAKNFFYSKTKITYLRYLDDIIFYGFYKKEMFLTIQKKIITFLKKRNFTINFSAKNIFQFKPRSAFSFLGYKYVFILKFKKQRFNKGRFTKKGLVFCKKLKLVFLIIDPNLYRAFKFSIRRMFKTNYFHHSVSQFMNLLNNKLKRFILYFSYSFQMKIQLNSLNKSIYKWFCQWIKKKYRSKPKLLIFLNKNFFSNYKNFITLRKKKLIFLDFALKYKEWSIKQLQFVLLCKQQNVCFVCKQNIRSVKVLCNKIKFHYKFSFIFLIKKLFCVFLKINKFKDIFFVRAPSCVIFKKIDLCNEKLIYAVWKNQMVFSKSYIKLTHKTCNQKISKKLGKGIKKEIGRLKKSFPNCIYPFYNKILYFVRKISVKSIKYLAIENK